MPVSAGCRPFSLLCCRLHPACWWLSCSDPRSGANIQAVFNEERRGETRPLNTRIQPFIAGLRFVCVGRPVTGGAGTCVFCLLTAFVRFNEIRSISVMAAQPQGHEAEPGPTREALMIHAKSRSTRKNDSS